MNILELIDWRKECFFCQEELTIFPEVGGVSAKYSIVNDWLKLESQFLNFSVHTISGDVIEPEGQESTLNAFLERQSLKLNFQCVNCETEGKRYKYTGHVRLLPFTRRSTRVTLLEEQLYILDKWFLNQYKEKNEGWLRPWNSNRAEGSFYGTHMASTRIKLPFINLKELTAEQLENKFKTYIVFS